MNDSQLAQAAYLAYSEAMGTPTESALEGWELLAQYRPDLTEIWRKVAEAVLAVKAN
jgi:hypothetical protein